MLSAIAVKAGELLAAAVIAGIMLLAVVAAGVWWLRGLLRRRLQALGGATARQAAGAADAGRRWLWSRPLPDRRWVAAARARRRLWRAVSAAQQAGAAARAAGAPTGELDPLCRRLRQAAQDVGRSLAIARRAEADGGLEPASSQVSSLVQAAGQIQGAAAAEVAAMSGPAAASLADDVGREVVALSAGIASATHASGAGRRPGEVPSPGPLAAPGVGGQV